MEDPREPKENLKLSRSLEDKYRDHMVALTYMASARFGSGIDVTPGHPIVNEQQFEFDFEPIIVNPTQEVSASLESSSRSEVLLESPPPQENAPQGGIEEPPLDAGLSVEGDGLSGVSQASDPQPNLTPKLETFNFVVQPEPFAAQDVEVPMPPDVLSGITSVDIPEPSMPVIIDKDMPDTVLEPDVIQSLNETIGPQDIPRQPQSAIPFVQMPDVEPDPAWQNFGAEDNLSPDKMAFENMEAFRAENSGFLESLNNVLSGIIEDLRDARGRLTEIETSMDRRFDRYRT